MDIYEAQNLGTLLARNPYPGRGIVVGASSDGRCAAVAYFIMGRSENSRNRILERTGDGIRTRAWDESRVTDPRLILYHPVRRLGNRLIVSNGDQTDTLYQGLAAGKTFSEALSERRFEPDAPHFTPRISALLTFLPGAFSYELSILKSADGKGSGCNRFTFAYAPVRGVGHFLHTYLSDGSPLPSFRGEPERVAIGNDPQAFTSAIWKSLSPDNKISLYTNWVDLSTGEERVEILNRHQQNNKEEERAT